MPVISAFRGIVIRMFYLEHEPPHFHAEHRGQMASFDLDGQVIAGAIRSRVARRAIETWARAHQEELEENWRRMRAGKPLEWIQPLK